ncbi:hypothetical protein A3Q56_02940, partial [Intoshia linei]
MERINANEKCSQKIKLEPDIKLEKSKNTENQHRENENAPKQLNLPTKESIPSIKIKIISENEINIKNDNQYQRKLLKVNEPLEKPNMFWEGVNMIKNYLNVFKGTNLKNELNKDDYIKSRSLSENEISESDSDSNSDLEIIKINKKSASLNCKPELMKNVNNDDSLIQNKDLISCKLSINEKSANDFVVPKPKTEIIQNKRDYNFPDNQKACKIIMNEIIIQKLKMESLFNSNVVLNLPDKGEKIKQSIFVLKEKEKFLKVHINKLPEDMPSVDSLENEFSRLSVSKIQSSQTLHKLKPSIFQQDKNVYYGGRMNQDRKDEANLVTNDALEYLHSQLAEMPPKTKETQKPEFIITELMSHQKQALTWLLWREKSHPKGGILADDMGLGKTLQMISLIIIKKPKRMIHPVQLDYGKKLVDSNCTLIVCPASILMQWSNEFKKHVDLKLKIMHHHGPNREKNAFVIASYDVVITTYGIVSSEINLSKKLPKKEYYIPVNDALEDIQSNGPIGRINWKRIILDEGHIIRNPSTIKARTCCRLFSKYRWILTGTPVQNKLLDVYSLLRFLRCRPFDEYNLWKKQIESYSEKCKERLSILMSSILLRRMKTDKLSNGNPLIILPEKKIMDHRIDLSRYEQDFYTAYETKAKHKFKLFLGHNISMSNVLIMILRLRQICTNINLMKKKSTEPDSDTLESTIDDLVDKISSVNINDKEKEKENEYPIEEIPSDFVSTKMKMIYNDIQKVRSESKNIKCIIVSQWTSFLDLMCVYLDKKDVGYQFISGKVTFQDRFEISRNFNQDKDGPPILLLSLLAGGVGLNLVGGNHLYLTDVHWNPAHEMQAFDRIYRIGQKRNMKTIKSRNKLDCKGMKSMSDSDNLKIEPINKTYAGLNNMIHFDGDEFDEDEMKEILKSRYQQDIMYTFLGDTLISINPYTEMNIYNASYVKKYKTIDWTKKNIKTVAHPFAIANRVLKPIKHKGISRNKSIIITGESGSGKTEMTKILMKYLMLSASTNKLHKISNDIISSSNMILEAMGNSRTINNTNSSRFGKRIKILLDINSKPCAIKMDTFLFEKSRASSVLLSQRNFHIFYRFIHGCKKIELESMALKKDVRSYKILKTQYDLEFEPFVKGETEQFTKIICFLKTIVTHPDDVDSFKNILAALIHFGNIMLGSRNMSMSQESMDGFSIFCNLMKINIDDAKTAIYTKNIRTVSSSVRVDYTNEQTIHIKIGIIMKIYYRLFKWVVSLVNKKLDEYNEEIGEDFTTIDILDIYGFENNMVNEFEQLCINYCNEKLHYLTIGSILISEQNLMSSEYADYVEIPYKINDVVIKMIESNYTSIFSSIEDCCVSPIPKSSNVTRSKANKSIKLKFTQFSIIHYADIVTYDSSNFIQHNVDIFHFDFKEMLYKSECSLIRHLFKDGQAQKDVTKRKATLAIRYKQSLIKIINELSDNTETFNINCLKPNLKMLPHCFEDKQVSKQIKYLGLAECYKVRKSGYSSHVPYSTFLDRYIITCPKLWPQCKDDLTDQKKVEMIINSAKLNASDQSCFGFGKTTLFMHSKVDMNIFENLMEKHKPKAIAIIQNVLRGHINRRKKKIIESVDEIRIFLKHYLLIKFLREIESNNQFTNPSIVLGKHCKNWPKCSKSILDAKLVFSNIYGHSRSNQILNENDEYKEESVKLLVICTYYFGSNRHFTDDTRNWKGDYLTMTLKGDDLQMYNDKLKKIFAKSPKASVLFSSFIIKMNSRGINKRRAFLLTSDNIYIMDSKKKFETNSIIDIHKIESVNISKDVGDQLILIKLSSGPFLMGIIDRDSDGVAELFSRLYLHAQYHLNTGLEFDICEQLKIVRNNKTIPIITKETNETPLFFKKKKH